MKKILIILIVLALFSGGTFLYITRPVSAPSGEAPLTTVTPPADVTEAETQVFAINSEKSEAKFEIDEVLNGNPFHVVGTTKDVTGRITVDSKNPGSSSVSTISINARTLKTDSERRDGAIARLILKSEENEFITFTATSVSGLPEKPVLGQEYPFQVIGVLIIAGTAKETTFDVQATMVSETSIQ